MAQSPFPRSEDIAGVCRGGSTRSSGWSTRTTGRCSGYSPGPGCGGGEVAGLRCRDLRLDGSAPHVHVERAWSEKGGRVKRPKSRHGLRDVPLDPALVRVLRAHLGTVPPDGSDALAFPSRTGTPLRQENLRRRVLRPAAEEAGAGWAGFHTFRHTFASLHVARGTNLLQLSRLLGHHSPEFTLRVYGHLIPGDELTALDLEAELENAGGSGPEVSKNSSLPEPSEHLARVTVGREDGIEHL